MSQSGMIDIPGLLGFQIGKTSIIRRPKVTMTSKRRKLPMDSAAESPFKAGFNGLVSDGLWQFMGKSDLQKHRGFMGNPMVTHGFPVDFPVGHWEAWIGRKYLRSELLEMQHP